MITNNSQSTGFDETAFGSVDRTGAPAPPEPTNEGGITIRGTSTISQTSESPRLVTRGESLYHEVIGSDGESYVVVNKNGYPKLIHIPKPKIDGNPSAAIVDYLNCTFPFGPKLSLADFFYELFRVLGPEFAPAVDRNCGKYSYEHSFSLGASAALFCYGGNNHTGFLSFCGESCHRIRDWKHLVHYLSKILKAKITRWDGAHDDFGGIHDVDEALRMYQAGMFTNGGREPLMDQRGNWIKPDGRGRTLYIGCGKNGKLTRIYEKGMQLGIPWHPWVRWETQLGSRDRIIPWDAVLEPGKYLAGGYPKAMGWISEEQSRIRTLRKTASIGYESLNHWASVAYGKHINVMMQVEGSAEKVIKILRRDGLPARLQLPVPPNCGEELS